MMGMENENSFQQEKNAGYQYDSPLNDLEKNIYTETQLCEALGWSKELVSRLRSYKQLPFVRITKRERLYYIPSVMEWIRKRIIVLNKDQ
jgi:hypothetical protein